MGRFLLNKKAQVLSADLVVSIFIFTIIISLFFIFWRNVYNNLTMQEKFLELQYSAIRISNMLVKTTGYPSNWNSTNVVQIGLASEANVLSIEKLRVFLDINYAEIKRIMKISEDFRVRVKYRNGSTILDNLGLPLEKGLEPSPSAKIIVPIERPCLLKLENVTVICIFEFKLWST
ncbi:MAG: hypothetical protein OH319_01925 [Candidatus Parvarchaeota archaeon]|nr:hypothetical protein [Candidatus Jingweiarchaeum tengchongense]MCW1299928.1 hypothetical protein [Candidatus Jingweiarchaeum tengchongense]MCW1305119.1 hypothetical protein [Candidatus Jingweiarchaeum tengchongense]MCW1305550.1 hypothetical protein [Candidatus Jingweiarchaeum tengchongense]MCW1310368.1 hypothetical protein [Candidatus Jingweiarchaeum tengchongense]